MECNCRTDKHPFWCLCNGWTCFHAVQGAWVCESRYSVSAGPKTYCYLLWISCSCTPHDPTTKGIHYYGMTHNCRCIKRQSDIGLYNLNDKRSCWCMIQAENRVWLVSFTCKCCVPWLWRLNIHYSVPIAKCFYNNKDRIYTHCTSSVLVRIADLISQHITLGITYISTCKGIIKGLVRIPLNL